MQVTSSHAMRIGAACTRVWLRWARTCAQVPLREFMAERGAYSGAGTRLLEVAGGTGRFATFLKASLCSPLDPHLEGAAKSCSCSPCMHAEGHSSCLTRLMPLRGSSLFSVLQKQTKRSGPCKLEWAS